MPTALVLVDNLFSAGPGGMYPDHTVSSAEEATGHEAFRVGQGRRSRSNTWTPTSTDTDARIQVDFNDRLRAFNCLVIDRATNLLGYDVEVPYWSASSSTGAPLAWSGTIPAGSAPGSLDDANGVVTEEGAFIKRFDMVASAVAAVDIPAMGAGLVPQIGMMHLGLCLEIPVPDYPWAEDDQELITADIATDWGWIGSPTVNVRRSGMLSLRLSETDDETPFRLMAQTFAQRYPMWIIYDIQQSERAVCGIRQPGSFGWRYDRDWLNKRRIDIPWMEHEPKPLG